MFGYTIIIAQNVNLGVSYNFDHFGTLKMILVFGHTIMEYLHDELTWGNIMQMTKYCFQKLLWVNFLKKLIFQERAELQ